MPRLEELDACVGQGAVERIAVGVEAIHSVSSDSAATLERIELRMRRDRIESGVESLQADLANTRSGCLFT